MRRLTRIITTTATTAAAAVLVAAPVLAGTADGFGWYVTSIAVDTSDAAFGVVEPFGPGQAAYAGMIPLVVSPSAVPNEPRVGSTAEFAAVTNLLRTFCVDFAGGSVSLDTSYAAPGSTLRILASGMPASALVTATINGTAAGSATADASGYANVPVTVPATATLGSNLTVTFTSGATTTTAKIKVSEPYVAKAWSTARTANAQYLGQAAWIAAHTDLYSMTGTRSKTLGTATDEPVTAQQLTGNATVQPANRNSVEFAAGQLAVWQALSGLPAASPTGPIGLYRAATTRSAPAQFYNNGGTFSANPTSTEVDAVADRAQALFEASFGTDATFGTADDNKLTEKARAWELSLAVVDSADGTSATVTATVTSTTGAAAAAPLAGVTVTVSGADFDATTAGVQNLAAATAANGTVSATVAKTAAAQPLTATATVVMPAGTMLGAVSDTGPGSTPPVALQQVITAEAYSLSASASGSVAALGSPTSSSPTTTPPTTTMPGGLPDAGPFSTLVVLLVAFAGGAGGLVLRRRHS
jgi:hypothetical protein